VSHHPGREDGQVTRAEAMIAEAAAEAGITEADLITQVAKYWLKPPPGLGPPGCTITEVRFADHVRAVPLPADLMVMAPRQITVEAGGLTADLTIDYDAAQGRFACTELATRAGIVSSQALRKLPIGELVQTAVLTPPGPMSLADYDFTCQHQHEPGDGRYALLKTPEGFPGDGPTPANIKFTAQAYTLAYAIGANPTQSVEEFGLSRATAIRWIAKARAAGYLGPAVKGRAGGPAPAGG
jgi:hypothetical protein